MAVPPQSSDAITSSGPPDAQHAPLSDPPHLAIALQPPNQSDTPHRPNTDPQVPTQPPTAGGFSQRPAEEEVQPVITEVSLYTVYIQSRVSCYCIQSAYLSFACSLKGHANFLQLSEKRESPQCQQVSLCPPLTTDTFPILFIQRMKEKHLLIDSINKASYV